MPKGTSHGIEDNYFNHFGDFDFVSKETGYVWMIRPATLGHHPKPEKVFHGTTVGWNRNKLLIDFDYIPPMIVEGVLNQYEQTTTSKPGSLLNYFIKHRLKQLTEHIGDFI